jgi:hypothetical protein
MRRWKDSDPTKYRIALAAQVLTRAAVDGSTTEDEPRLSVDKHGEVIEDERHYMREAARWSDDDVDRFLCEAVDGIGAPNECPWCGSCDPFQEPDYEAEHADGCLWLLISAEYDDVADDAEQDPT